MSGASVEFQALENSALIARSVTPSQILGGSISVSHPNTTVPNGNDDCVVGNFDNGSLRPLTIAPHMTLFSVPGHLDPDSCRPVAISPATLASSPASREERGIPKSRSESRLCRTPYRTRTLSQTTFQCCGKQPACQRCESRGLVCVYAAEPRRGSKSRTNNSASVSPKSSSLVGQPQGWSPHSGASDEVDIELLPSIGYHFGTFRVSRISSAPPGQSDFEGVPHIPSPYARTSQPQPVANGPAPGSSVPDDGPGRYNHFGPLAGSKFIYTNSSTSALQSDGLPPSGNSFEWAWMNPTGLGSLLSRNSTQGSSSSLSSPSPSSPRSSASSLHSPPSTVHFHAGVEGMPFDMSRCGTQTLPSPLTSERYSPPASSLLSSSSLGDIVQGVSFETSRSYTHNSLSSRRIPADPSFSSSVSSTPFSAGADEGMPFDMSSCDPGEASSTPPWNTGAQPPGPPDLTRSNLVSTVLVAI